MSLLATPIARLDGTPTSIGEITGGRPALLVNVASRCGLTSQYATLEDIHSTYADRGFTVVGVPCNQFGGQEPGTSAEIAEFCSATYGVTFPMTEKVEVNGPGRHPIYAELTTTPNEEGAGGKEGGGGDEEGAAGDIEWNFEKFLVDGAGTVVARFTPDVQPDDKRVIDTIEQLIRQPSSIRELAVLAPRDGSSGPARRQFRPRETAVLAPRDDSSGPAHAATSCRFVGPRRQFVGPHASVRGATLVSSRGHNCQLVVRSGCRGRGGVRRSRRPSGWPGRPGSSSSR